MRAIAVVLTVLVFLLADGVSAQEDHAYVFVTANDTMAVYLDTKSIQATNQPSQVMAWTVWVYYPDKNMGAGPSSYGLSRDYYDCGTQQSATNYVLDYNLKGDVVDSAQPYAQLKPVVPDSMGEAALKAACGGWQSLPAPPFSGVTETVSAARAMLKLFTTPQHKPHSK